MQLSRDAVSPEPPPERISRAPGLGQTGVRLLAGQADLVVVVDVPSFSTAVSVAVERRAIVSPYRVRDATAEVYARRAGATPASPDRGAPGPTLSPASLLGTGPTGLVHMADIGPRLVSGAGYVGLPQVGFAQRVRAVDDRRDRAGFDQHREDDEVPEVR